MHVPGRPIGNPPSPSAPGLPVGRSFRTQESGPRAALTSGSPPDCDGRSGTSGGSQPPVRCAAPLRSLVYGLSTLGFPRLTVVVLRGRAGAKPGIDAGLKPALASR